MNLGPPLQCPAARDTGQLIGLGALARIAFGGGDLTPVKAGLLKRLRENDNDAAALMDLATVSQLMGQHRLGLSLQALALKLQQLYPLPVPDPVGIRLLAILGPGDLAQNNALEFLIEGSDVRLDLLYVGTNLALPAVLPDHDLVMVALCESDRNRPQLRHIQTLLSSWPRPVICAPERIARLSRDRASQLLQGSEGAVMPLTARVDRRTLEKAACSKAPLAEIVAGSDFPLIVRPVDSQKGRGLAKLDDRRSLADYLQASREKAFYVARFVDYRGADGQFRKYRIVLIDGRPYACHMAISGRWIVHYMSAGMTESPAKRAEEERFFASFDDDFARRHAGALRSIAGRLELQYAGIDCGETPDGQLLIFEVDSGMTVHAMDSPDIFPYKQPQMRKVFRAFRRMLTGACVQHGTPLGDG
jgi:hypothetical protein